jgi:cell division septum initiation protein DivIVA
MNADSLRKARIWLGVVFVVGAAIGAVFGYSFAHHHAYAATPPTAISEPERRAKRVADMTQELGLTPDQVTKVDDIIKSTHAEMKSVRDKAEKDVDGLREQARNQVRTLLTDQQKPKFETMVQRDDERRKQQQALQQPH